MLPKERRAYRLGFLRAMRQARKQMHAMAADFDAELVALRDEFHELAVAHHRQCIAAALDEAAIERAANPGKLLH